jgi:YHS domain-containing protein
MKTLALMAIAALTAVPVSYAKETVAPVNAKGGLALKGYDAVAYFTESKPVKGSPSFTYEWNGAKWQFSTKQNLDTFKSNPEKYAPQYGGYCAYAVSEHYTADADPMAWKIVDGKLYVNYNKDIQQKWAQDAMKRIQSADSNWPALHK